jgi:hypothetical protein
LKSGKWVPASDQELDVIQAGTLGQVGSFLEGVLPIVGIAEALGLVEEGRSAALADINPRSEQAGFIAGMAGLGAALLKNGGKLALKAGVTGKGAKAATAADAAINVPRNFKQVVRGQDPGFVRGAAGGLAGAGQAVVEGSQILRGAFPKAAPNIQKQLATNIAATRGVGLAPQVGGKVPRATVAAAKKRVDDLYDAGVRDAEAFVDVSGFQSLADTIKMPSSLEQILFGDLLKGGVMKPKQVLNRRKAIAKINAETQDDIMRDASRKVLDLIDSVIDGDAAFDPAILAQADEEWRFLQALQAGVGKGEEISNSRWTGALAKFFPKEFGRADLATASQRGRKLSTQGQESISAALRIEAAQGVKTPQEGLTAIDFLLGGGALLGGTGAGIFRE